MWHLLLTTSLGALGLCIGPTPRPSGAVDKRQEIAKLCAQRLGREVDPDEVQELGMDRYRVFDWDSTGHTACVYHGTLEELSVERIGETRRLQSQLPSSTVEVEVQP